jgi:hypothetical protein
MCVDYTSLNKACPKDRFPLPCIDQVIDLTARCDLLSFQDTYSGCHQIPLIEADQHATMFITPINCFCYVKNAIWTEEREDYILVVHAILLQRANRVQPRGLCQCHHDKILKEVQPHLGLGRNLQQPLMVQH